MVELHKQNYSENKKLYNRIENTLKEKLGYNTPINHVGSTAIKNMWEEKYYRCISRCKF